MQAFNQLNTKDIVDYLIILDIDGTLINDDEHQLDKKTLDKISELKESNQIYLCSNSRNHERNKKVASLANVEYLDTDIRKPSKKILDLIDHSPFKKRLVIGDKFLTDGLFAKNIKAEFIKTKRITSENDRLYIKFLYLIDDWAYAIFEKLENLKT
ncbi:HAD hydrolase family protein [bacterium]|nr:HAD hydrolase family protein [bacterium]